MKTVILSLGALLFASILAFSMPVTKAQISSIKHSTYAQDTTVSNPSQQKADEFKEVTIDQLNEKVKAAVKGLSDKFEVNKIYYNAATKVTKVQVTSKADQAKAEISFNDEGQKIG